MKAAELSRASSLLRTHFATPDKAISAGIKVNRDGQRRSVFELMARVETLPEHIFALCPGAENIEPSIMQQISTDALYASYIERQARDIETLKKDAQILLPLDLDYDQIAGLSNELKTKLNATRPSSVAQASRIDGMTPAALNLLIANTRKLHRKLA